MTTEQGIITVLNNSDTPLKALEIGRKMSPPRSRGDVNRVIYKMKDVEMSNPGATPPLWRVISASSHLLEGASSNSASPNRTRSGSNPTESRSESISLGYRSEPTSSGSTSSEAISSSTHSGSTASSQHFTYSERDGEHIYTPVRGQGSSSIAVVNHQSSPEVTSTTTSPPPAHEGPPPPSNEGTRPIQVQEDNSEVSLNDTLTDKCRIVSKASDAAHPLQCTDDVNSSTDARLVAKKGIKAKIKLAATFTTSVDDPPGPVDPEVWEEAHRKVTGRPGSGDKGKK